MKFLKKIYINILIIIKDYFDLEIIKLTKLNRKLFNPRLKKSDIILFDFFRVLETEIIRSYL